MRSILSRVVSIITVGILFATATAAGAGCRNSNFACFKRKMMLKVGQKITVEGELALAKLGWIVRLDHWGVYIYAVQDSDTSKMRALDSLTGQAIKVTGTLKYSPGSPAPRSDVASVPEHFFFDVAEVKVSSNRPLAEMTFREMRLRKPPLAELYFDIVLRNDRTGPRWFLLPSNLSPTPASVGTNGGVDGIEVFAPHGKGRVILGHFLGTGGFHALLLPAHAEVHLRTLPISYWGDLPDHLDVEIVMARRLTVGDEKAGAWFKVNPMCSAQADIVENVLSQTRMVRSRHTPDNKEVAAVIDEDRRLKLQVAIERKD